MSTSSSSPAYPATQRERSVHPVHLQDHSVDKLRHQEALWREDLQSGGNPRTTTPTGYEPERLATVTRIKVYSGELYQIYDAQGRAPVTEEVEEFRKIGTAGVSDSKLSETSYIQSQMHFDDSVESTADSDLEGGEFRKDDDFTTVRPESFGDTRCMVFIWTGKPDQEFCVKKR